MWPWNKGACRKRGILTECSKSMIDREGLTCWLAEFSILLVNSRCLKRWIAELGSLMTWESLNSWHADLFYTSFNNVIWIQFIQLIFGKEKRIHLHVYLKKNNILLEKTWLLTFFFFFFIKWFLWTINGDLKSPFRSRLLFLWTKVSCLKSLWYTI